MTLLNRLVSMARWVFGRKQIDAQLDQELEAFVEMAAARKIREGMTPAAARREAILELGGVEQAKERVRSGRHGAWYDELERDLRYGFRMARKTPAFTVIVVLTLALGIGANTAIFGLIDALMLRWLPVRDPQQLVLVQLQARNGGPARETFSYPIVRALSGEREIFSGVAGFSIASFNVGAAGSVARVPGAWVSGQYYETLGLAPSAGRFLSERDDEPGAPLAAVISDGYWGRHFARASAAVGQNLLVNGVAVAIVGVSPRGFVGTTVGAVADITMPFRALPVVTPQMAGLLGPGNFWIQALARPAPGVSVPRAEARMTARWPVLSEQAISPAWPLRRRQAIADSVFRLAPGATGWTFLRDMFGKPLWVLMAAVALVLLIACANVASLLLARASARRREIAMRVALGASRGRVVRQLLTESALLSTAGGLVGLGLAWASGRYLVDVSAGGPLSITLDLTPNWHVLVFTAAVAIATAMLFGLAPALHASADRPARLLNEGAWGGRVRSRLLSSLVSVQVALSIVLLVGAGLFVGTLRNLHNLDAGFIHEGVLLVDIESGRLEQPLALVDDIRRVPGVVSASVSTHTPLSGATWTEPAAPRGQPLPENDSAQFIGVGPDFFRTMQTTLAAGREFSDRDSAESPAVAVVSEAFVQRHFPNQDAIGQRVSARVTGRLRDLEIVGVARNVRMLGLRRTPYPAVYIPLTQLTRESSLSFEIRAAGSIAQTAGAVRKVVQTRLPSVPVEVRPLSAQVDASVAQERLMATLVSGFGALALILACTGLYGLLAYTVAERRREIGIRLALGAQGRALVAMVMSGAVRLIATGVAVGIPAAWTIARWIESMLFALKPNDPAAIGGAILTLTAAALTAAYVPARRASRVDPMVTLRHE